MHLLNASIKSSWNFGSSFPLPISVLTSSIQIIYVKQLYVHRATLLVFRRNSHDPAVVAHSLAVSTSDFRHMLGLGHKSGIFTYVESEATKAFGARSDATANIVGRRLRASAAKNRRQIVFIAADWWLPPSIVAGRKLGRHEQRAGWRL